MTLEEVEISTSFYYCSDSIENFKIKVILKPIKNLIIPLPEFDASQCTYNRSIGYEENLSDTEEYIFRWQEKVFRETEYSNQLDLKKSFNSDNFSKSSNIQNSRKLFSYVDVDNFSFQIKELDLFKQNSQYFSPLVAKLSKLNVSGPNLKNFKNIPKRKIINYYPSEKYKNISHIIVKKVQRMFIMIDLENKTEERKVRSKFQNSEHVLCSLSYDTANKVLEITPSFSNKKPYILNVGQDEKIYYWLCHASDVSAECFIKETKLLNLVFDHQEEFKKLQVGTDFLHIKPNHFCVTLLCEILSAKNFIYDNLQIYYFIKLPHGWKCEDNNKLIGATQASCTNSDGSVFFSYIFEVNFSVDLNSMEDFFVVSPELFFEVKCTDKFNRYRSEGYSNIMLPNTPGMFNYVLKCWVPLDKTIRLQLERYFIGGGSELKEISYTGLFKSEKVGSMSRFGFRTLPTGDLNVKLSLIQQAENLKSKKFQIKKGSYICNTLETNSLIGNINDILEAFKRARDRMLQAKKSLEKI